MQLTRFSYHFHRKIIQTSRLVFSTKNQQDPSWMLIPRKKKNVLAFCFQNPPRFVRCVCVGGERAKMFITFLRSYRCPNILKASLPLPTRPPTSFPPKKSLPIYPPTLSLSPSPPPHMALTYWDHVSVPAIVLFRHVAVVADAVVTTIHVLERKEVEPVAPYSALQANVHACVCVCVCCVCVLW